MTILDSATYKFNDYCGLDLETDGLDPKTNNIVTIAIQSDSGSYLWKAWAHDKQFFVNLFTELSRYKVVLHNAKFDLSFILEKYNIFLPKVVDTFICSRIISNGKLEGNSLPDCLERYLNVVDDAHKDKKDIRLSFKVGVLTKAQLEYATSDIVYLPELGKVMEKACEPYSDVYKLEHELLPVIIKMEAKGVRMDEGKLATLISEWSAKNAQCLDILDKEVDKLYDKFGVIKPLFNNTNYSSPEQLINLFKLFKQPVPSDGEKDTTAEDTLLEYINERPSSPMGGFVKALLDFREYQKLVSTYGQPLLDRVVDGILYGEFKQMGTTTGRLAAANPNLQNQPSDGDGGVIRECFLADEGHEMITSDMHMAEIRIAADYSKDKLLLKAVKEGADMHSKLASVSFSIIFGVPVEVSKSTTPITINGVNFIPDELRTAHKSATFCKFYKGGPKRIYGVLSKYINMFHKNGGMKIAYKVSEALDNEMKGLSYYLLDVISEANRKGFLIGKYGRIRYFRPNAFGSAANYKIQNANGEAIKLAMVKVDKYLTENNLGRIVLSVHDELVCSVISSRAEEASLVIKQIMADSLAFFLDEVEGGASVTIAKHWKK